MSVNESIYQERLIQKQSLILELFRKWKNDEISSDIYTQEIEELVGQVIAGLDEDPNVNPFFTKLFRPETPYIERLNLLSPLAIAYILIWAKGQIEYEIFPWHMQNVSKQIDRTYPQDYIIDDAYRPQDNFLLALSVLGDYDNRFYLPEDAPIMIEMFKIENLKSRSTYENWCNYWIGVNIIERAKQYIYKHFEELASLPEVGGDPLEELGEALFVHPWGNFPPYEVWQDRDAYRQWIKETLPKKREQFESMELTLAKEFYSQKELRNKS